MKNCFASNKDTIFALSTGNVKSGVAVIRISGENAEKAKQLFSNQNLPDRYASLSSLRKHDGTKIDDAIIIYFQAPKSFTGENIIEIQTHGSKAVIHSIIHELSLIDGFRLAEPGEFTMRAFYNNKIDLTQAEGLADLIDAETDAQLQQSLKQYSGFTKDLIQKWRSELIRIMSLVEAYIDFPDEDLPDDLIDSIESDVKNLRASLANAIDDNQVGEKIRDGLNVVILGEPNVGKSSLINLLAKREVAIVSDQKGTTRDAIEVHLDIAGYAVNITDTAGIRKTDDHIEKRGVEIANQKSQEADIKILLLDSTNPEISEQTLKLIDKKTIIVHNKIDLKNPKFPKFDCLKQVGVSVKESKNIDILIECLKSSAISFFSNCESSIISRQRHRDALDEASKELENFTLNKEIELAAEDLRLASYALGRITGEIDVEYILDKIFSSFCIGK